MAGGGLRPVAYRKGRQRRDQAYASFATLLHLHKYVTRHAWTEHDWLLLPG